MKQTPKNRFWTMVMVIGLLVVPSAALALTSTNYEIIDGGTSGFGQHTSTTASYQLVGSLDPMVAHGTTASYQLNSGSTLHAEYCGDGEVNGSEACDGSALGGETCVTQGYDSGSISCSSSCALVLTGCVTGGAGPGGGGGGGGAASVPGLPVVDSFSSSTLEASMVLTGEREMYSNIVFNVADLQVTYPTSTTWTALVPLELGVNTIEIHASNNVGDSGTVSLSIERLYPSYGDANGDGQVNDYDLSLIAYYWGTSNETVDFNFDGLVDDYDLSILAAYWIN